MNRTTAGLMLGILSSAALHGCTRDDPRKAQVQQGAAVPAPGRAEIMAAPGGNDEVPALVQGELARAKRDGRQLLVYVGATWCEPCTRFHDAVMAGELDTAFPTLRLLEFDLDRDRDRLDRAGYGSKMIPLFVAPGPDGRGTPLRIEGSVKGEGAVMEIVPRLLPVVAEASRSSSGK